MFSPLEQFNIINIIYLKGLFNFELTNLSIFILLVNLFIYFFFYLNVIYNFNIVAKKSQIFIELLYTFLLNLVKNQLKFKGLKFFPLYFYLFLFVLISNLIGLIPYSFTITSQFIITGLIALSINIGLFIFGFIFNGIRFLKFFIPKGVPILLLPLITIIEIFSHCIRSLSLSVRLFCNMTAGHTLLHILISFCILFINNFINFFLIFLILLILAIYLLEFAIAFIQTYVFIILIIIYTNDSILGGH